MILKQATSLVQWGVKAGLITPGPVVVIEPKLRNKTADLKVYKREYMREYRRNIRAQRANNKVGS